MDKAEASVNPDPATKVYGENDPALTAKVTGVKDGDTLNYTLKREAGENVGKYAITAELGENPNYDVTTGEAEFEITRKGIAVPTAVTGLIYNGTEQTGVAEATGYTVTDGKATNAGSYTATATLAEGYKWSDDTTEAKQIEWSIAKATYDMSAVTFDSDEVTYTGKEQKIEISGTLPEGVEVSYSNNKGTNADTYAATASFTGNSDNYEAIDDMSATLTINKAPLTATADDKSVTVGDAAPTYTVSYTGWVNGESINTVTPTTAAELACEYTPASPTGEYNITFTTEPAFANYTVTAVPGKLTAAQAPAVAVEPNPATDLVYNGTAQRFYKDAGAGQNWVRSGGFEASQTDAGEYFIKVTPENGYTWSDGTTAEKTINWSIGQKEASLEWGTISFTYDGDPHVPTCTAGGLCSGDACTVTVSGEQTVAGTHTATATALSNNNYKLPSNVTTQFTITAPAPTTYTVTFDLNGISGTAPETQKVAKDGKVTEPDDPTDTVHTFAGWYKTKDATTGVLSDPWDFTNDTVTEDITLYAQWTRTLESIYTISDIPKATNNTAPDNAWVNDDEGKAFIAHSGKNSEVLYLYKQLQPSGAKQMSCKKTENFTKIGDDYVFSYGTQYGVFTLHMTGGKFTSVTYDGAGTNYEELSGTYTAPAAAAPLRTALRAPMPEVEDALLEEAPETEAFSELPEITADEQTGGTETIEAVVEAEVSETVEGTEQAEDYETVEGTEQTEGTESVEEIVESAPTPVLGGILDTVDLNNVQWGDGNGKECYISGDNLVFANSSGTDEIGLDTQLTQNGSDWMLVKDSVTITFVMKDDTLDRIVYAGDGSFDAVYSAPAEEEDTEEDEPTTEEPVEEIVEEIVEEPVEELVEEAVTEEPTPEDEEKEKELTPEEEPVPESEPEEPVEQKSEEQTEPAEPEEVTGQTDPVEEAEAAAEE